MVARVRRREPCAWGKGFEEAAIGDGQRSDAGGGDSWEGFSAMRILDLATSRMSLWRAGHVDLKVSRRAVESNNVERGGPSRKSSPGRETEKGEISQDQSG